MNKTQRANQIVAKLLKEISTGKKELAANEAADYNKDVVRAVKAAIIPLRQMLGNADISSNGESADGRKVVLSDGVAYFEGFEWVADQDFNYCCILGAESMPMLKKIMSIKLPDEDYIWSLAVIPRGKKAYVGILVYDPVSGSR